MPDPGSGTVPDPGSDPVPDPGSDPVPGAGSGTGKVGLTKCISFVIKRVSHNGITVLVRIMSK